MNNDLQELREFHHFLGEKLGKGPCSLSPEEVLHQWRQLRPDPQTLEEDLAAIQEALDDMSNGDKGKPLDDVLTEIRSKFGLSSRS